MGPHGPEGVDQGVTHGRVIGVAYLGAVEHDLDGLVVIPQAVEKEAIERAKVKAAGENQARNDLERGDLLRDVYDRYGIL